MRINGEDINIYGASQHNVVMNYSSISNASEWNVGNLLPLMLSGETGFKTIKVAVILKAENREQIWTNGQMLISKLLQPVVVELDGFSNYFYVALKKVEHTEKNMQKWHKIILELFGYEYGQEITASTTGTTLVLNNPGNLETPAVIEFVPTIGKVGLEITGLSRNRITKEETVITLDSIFAGMKIVIDGEKGIITEDGGNKFGETHLWEFPSLKPGRNETSMDKNVGGFTVKFKPRYL